MDLVQALLLALLQGITEFLPISSSAHLILPSRLLGWPDQGLAFDVAVHLGSLCAVLVALRGEVAGLIRGTLRALATRRLDRDATLALWVVAGTMPVVLAGLALKDLVETTLRSVAVIGTTTVVFGVLLAVADRLRPAAPRDEYALRARDVAVIGLAQCLALVPGTSRSGITMTAALAMGLSRSAAARFSFLLSIPTIAGAAVLSLGDLLEAAAPVPWDALATGFLAAALSAWACIRFFLALLERTGFLPYVLYRLVLGTVLLLFFV